MIRTFITSKFAKTSFKNAQDFYDSLPFFDARIKPIVLENVNDKNIAETASSTDKKVGLNIAYC